MKTINLFIRTPKYKPVLPILTPYYLIICQHYFHFLVQVSHWSLKHAPFSSNIIKLTFPMSTKQINLTENQVFILLKAWINQLINQPEDWIDCFHLRLHWSSQSLYWESLPRVNTGPMRSACPNPLLTSSPRDPLSGQPLASLTCIGRLFAMVKLGMGGRALYVFVRAVSVRPNMEPEVKEETAGRGTRQSWWESEPRANSLEHTDQQN